MKVMKANFEVFLSYSSSDKEDPPSNRSPRNIIKSGLNGKMDKRKDLLMYKSV